MSRALTYHSPDLREKPRRPRTSTCVPGMARRYVGACKSGSSEPVGLGDRRLQNSRCTSLTVLACGGSHM